MIDRIGRWWRSKGFGIHSPSAFRMVTEVIHPSKRYGYYAYSRLRSMSHSGAEYRLLKLIFRIVVDLQPATVAFLEPDARLEYVVKMAVPGCEKVDDPGDAKLVFVNSRAEVEPGEGNVFFFSDASESVRRYEARLSAGHLFLIGEYVLGINRKDLPRQTFKLKF